MDLVEREEKNVLSEKSLISDKRFVSSSIRSFVWIGNENNLWGKYDDNFQAKFGERWTKMFNEKKWYILIGNRIQKLKQKKNDEQARHQH